MAQQLNKVLILFKFLYKMMIDDVLRRLKEGKISLEEAKREIKLVEFEKLKNATLDIKREHRVAKPEAILAEFKSVEDVLEISKKVAEKNGIAIITRLKDEHIPALKREKNFEIEINERARCAIMRRKGFRYKKRGAIGVITAGTADIPVAEEAIMTLRALGHEIIYKYDVGIAGIQRIFEPIEEMIKKDVKAIIVVAGMEGALPSIVSSLVDVPVIAVPTSVGYGVGEGGYAALYSMLVNCSSGVGVVNIDNGFGAAVLASLIEGVSHKCYF